MSYERDGDDEIMFLCDNCGDPFYPETDDWNLARAKLVEEKWITTKDDDEWVHFCTLDCKNEYFKA